MADCSQARTSGERRGLRGGHALQAWGGLVDGLRRCIRVQAAEPTKIGAVAPALWLQQQTFRTTTSNPASAATIPTVPKTTATSRHLSLSEIAAMRPAGRVS